MDLLQLAGFSRPAEKRSLRKHRLYPLNPVGPTSATGKRRVNQASVSPVFPSACFGSAFLSCSCSIDYTATTSYKMSESALLRVNPLFGRALVPPECAEQLGH